MYLVFFRARDMVLKVHWTHMERLFSNTWRESQELTNTR